MTIEQLGPVEYEIRQKPYGWDGVELVFDFGSNENAEYAAAMLSRGMQLAYVLRDLIQTMNSPLQYLAARQGIALLVEMGIDANVDH